VNNGGEYIIDSFTDYLFEKQIIWKR
jgi:hypothetical protein